MVISIRNRRPTPHAGRLGWAGGWGWRFCAKGCRLETVLDSDDELLAVSQRLNLYLFLALFYDQWGALCLVTKPGISSVTMLFRQTTSCRKTSSTVLSNSALIRVLSAIWWVTSTQIWGATHLSCSLLPTPTHPILWRHPIWKTADGNGQS